MTSVGLTIKTEPEEMQQDGSTKRPTMTVFDSSPNARSKTLTKAEGEHTYGRLNQFPAHETGSYSVGVSEDIGNRRSMEDAFAFVVDYAGIQGQGYFAIFDGHAGKHAAEWCGKNFHEFLLRKLIEQPEKAIPETIASTFESVDQEITRMSEDTTTTSGCTAVAAFLRLEDEKGGQSFAPPLQELVQLAPTPSSSVSPSKSSRATTPTHSSKREKFMSVVSGAFSSGHKDKVKQQQDGAAQVKAEEKPPIAIAVNAPRRVLYMANVGDARAVLCRDGKAVRLTYDHKGTDKKEVKRIQQAGGFILNHRVNGILAVTRSLGDSSMKEHVVGQPFTSEIELTGEDDHIIIACDGLWDVIDDQGAVDLARGIPSAPDAAKALVRQALDSFSNDNVTVMVIKLHSNGAQTGQAAMDDVIMEPKVEDAAA